MRLPDSVKETHRDKIFIEDKKAITEHGIGAKTAVGYGYFRVEQ